MAKRIAKDDTDRFHDYSLYIPHRMIYLGSEEYNIEHGESGMDGAIAERVIKNLHILDSMSDDPITIILNNIGGDVNHGLAVFDAILTSSSYITIKVFGNCASMGSIVLQAADKRIMSPNAVQMIHYGSLELGGHAKTVYKYTDENKRIDEWMENLYMSKIKEKHPMFSVKKLKDLLNHDTFLTAHDSVNLGLADEILGDDSNEKND